MKDIEMVPHASSVVVVAPVHFHTVVHTWDSANAG